MEKICILSNADDVTINRQRWFLKVIAPAYDMYKNVNYNWFIINKKVESVSALMSILDAIHWKS